MQHAPIDPKALQPLFTKRGLPILAGLGLMLYGTSTSKGELAFSVGAALVGVAFVFSLSQELGYRRYGAAFRRLIVIGICLLPGIYLFNQEPNAREIASQNELHSSLCPDWFNMNFFDRYVVYRHRAWCRDFAAQYEQTSSVRTSAEQSTNNLWK